MTPTEMLHRLDDWRDSGWLRRLDVAFARFIHELDADAPASLLLAAALAAHLEGRGHSALPLAELAASSDALLCWPLEGGAALRQAWAEHMAHSEAGAPPAAWQSRSVLEIDPEDDTGASPLVLCRGLLYLRRYWRYESRVAVQINARAGQGTEPGETAATAIDRAKARHLLDDLFAAAGPEVDWQKIACALALRSHFTIITGGPGTGKTYTAARLLVLLQGLHAGAQPLRLAMAAPTGKAAARLRQSIQKALHGLRESIGESVGIGEWADQLVPARTLHALLGTLPGTRRFRHDATNPLDVDLLIVDEASMVHLEMMAQLLEALPAGARLVLLGDKDQLASVEAGAVLGDLCQGTAADDDAHGYGTETAAWIRDVAGQALPPPTRSQGAGLTQQTVVLRKSRRFDGPIGQLALAINAGNAASAVEMLEARADGPIAMRLVASAGAVLPVAIDGRDGAPGGYRAYLEHVSQGPASGEAFDDWAKAVLSTFDSFRVLTAVREGPWGVAGLNSAIERALSEAGLLQRRGEWYEGRPVIVTRNDASLGVFNGDVGVVLRGPTGDSALRCFFLDGDELRSVAVGRLADVETAFAMTVHKSQGSEFAHVLLVLPDEDARVLTRELVYTGITRASAAFTLMGKSTEQLTLATHRLTRRVSGLRQLLAKDKE
ncbi:MAG TPA: exodeoxyribonuclease V subunit alpha [Burkholderiaceae bacterium]|nr:exodeoxyribonuclease V subunit alpha [Burkholderiaceae bacterium]